MRKYYTCVFMDQEKKNPISTLIILCKQMSYCVSNASNISDMLTTLCIYLSAVTICELRDVSSEDFQHCLALRNMDFQIDIVLGAQSIFRAPII